MERPIAEHHKEAPPVRPVVTGLALGFMILLAVIGFADKAGHTNILSTQVSVVKEGYMSLRWERIGWTRLDPERRRALNQEILLTAHEAGLDEKALVLFRARELPVEGPFVAQNYNDLRSSLPFGERFRLMKLGYARPLSLTSVSTTLSVVTYRSRCRNIPNRFGVFGKSLSGSGEGGWSLRCVDLLSRWSCSWEGEAPNFSDLRTGLLSDSDD